MSSRHLNPYFHWCARCWKWVCDCVHCVEPLSIKRQPVKDLQIRSVGRAEQYPRPFQVYILPVNLSERRAPAVSPEFGLYYPEVVPHDFDPPEDQKVILIDAATRRKAEQLIESCEHCNALGAEVLFDNILDRVTGSDPRVTDYLLSEPAKCPYCRREILEKTLVEPK